MLAISLSTGIRVLMILIIRVCVHKILGEKEENQRRRPRSTLVSVYIDNNSYNNICFPSAPPLPGLAATSDLPPV